MSLLRSRALLAAGMSAALLAGLAVAESSAATSPDTTVGTPPETSVATSPQTAALEILPPNEAWGGATRGEWDARSTQSWMSMPADVNPNPGQSCGYGQSGPVFFLQFGLGTEAEGFTCVVAEGTAIYVSALGVVCTTVEGFEEGRFFGRSEDELRACTARELDESTDGNQQYRVNGQEVADLDTYRIASPLFTITLPENNIFGVEPGVGAGGVRVLQLHHRPATARRIRDHLLNLDLRASRRRRQRHRRSTPGDRATADDLELSAFRPRCNWTTSRGVPRTRRRPRDRGAPNCLIGATFKQ